MASQTAAAVAQDVIEHVLNPKKNDRLNLSAIIGKHGYKKSIQRTPQRVTKTKSYQSVLAPVIKRQEAHRNKIINELEKKDLSREEYRDLITGLKVLNHDIALLSGQSTSNQNIRFIVQNYEDKE